MQCTLRGSGGASNAKARCAKAATPERTQECMTGVLTEVSASCEGCGGALKHLDTSVMAAALEGCGSRANSRIND